MLKHLLLLGWFRVKPFLNYVVVVTLIAPLVATSGNSTSAKLSQNVAKITTNKTETTAVSEPQSDQVSLGSKAASSSDSLVRQSVAAAKPQLLQDELLSGTEENNTLSQIMPENDLLAAVELVPSTRESNSVSTMLSPSQHDLVKRLRSKIQIRSVTRSDGSVSKEVLTAQLMQAAKTESRPSSTTGPAVEQPTEDSAAQQDPVGSRYPIPWKWIQATQETMSSKGRSGVRYYRSVPVMSPDGRYAIYSRVQLEVKPEMYNSRVTSVLFIEDRQTKKLQVVTTTSPIHDPLLKVNVSSRYGDEQGSIAVLVPVSWSEKGDRFLARKFEGLMNTSDFTDHAVIWDRQKNHSNCVTPTQQKAEREMAVLLGWSKTHPDHVLFRAGEMGEENWPLVTVANDGSTAIATEADQPITFGQKVTELWANPPVAYR